MGLLKNICLFNILIIVTSYSNDFQPQGPGKYIFGIGCELHGEFVNAEEVTLFVYLLIPQQAKEKRSWMIQILSILMKNILKGKSQFEYECLFMWYLYCSVNILEQIDHSSMLMRTSMFFRKGLMEKQYLWLLATLSTGSLSTSLVKHSGVQKETIQVTGSNSKFVSLFFFPQDKDSITWTHTRTHTHAHAHTQFIST